MITDERATFANDVAVTAGAGTNQIGDTIDLQVPRDVGQGRPLYLCLQVSEAFAGGTDFQFYLGSDNSNAIATDGSENRHNVTDIFTAAQLTLGWRMSVALQAGDSAQGEDVSGYQRYLGLMGIGTGTWTAGRVTAFLTLDPPPGWTAYPDAQN